MEIPQEDDANGEELLNQVTAMSNSYERILLCIKLICSTSDEMKKIWLEACRQSFVKMLSEKQLRELEELKAKAQISNVQPDDLIDFFHLKSIKVDTILANQQETLTRELDVVSSDFSHPLMLNSSFLDQ